MTSRPSQGWEPLIPRRPRLHRRVTDFTVAVQTRKAEEERPVSRLPPCEADRKREPASKARGNRGNRAIRRAASDCRSPSGNSEFLWKALLEDPPCKTLTVVSNLHRNRSFQFCATCFVFLNNNEGIFVKLDVATVFPG